jgi:hypothetical protein
MNKRERQKTLAIITPVIARENEQGRQKDNNC